MNKMIERGAAVAPGVEQDADLVDLQLLLVH